MKIRNPLLSGAAFCSFFTAVNPASAQNWMLTSAPTPNWSFLASSADGTKLGAALRSGIYTLQTTPTPSLSIIPSDAITLLSWTIPSMDFGLQQNSELTTKNWTKKPCSCRRAGRFDGKPGASRPFALGASGPLRRCVNSFAPLSVESRIA